MCARSSSWKRHGAAAREVKSAESAQLSAARGGRGDGAGHERLQAVVGHEDLQRLPRGACGRGTVLAQPGSRLAGAVHQFAGAGDRTTLDERSVGQMSVRTCYTRW